MDNFKVYNPTSLFFGRNVIEKLNSCIDETGKRILLIYGQGSVKKNGVYDAVRKQIEMAGATVFEYSGIKSNPVYTDVDAAADMAKKNNVDLIIALGGGSVIDSAKMTALTACVNHSSWEFFIRKTTVEKALPLICVLTLAATGSEMNPYAVIQNDAVGQKLSYGHPLIFPKYAFLDPSYTISVPYNYTAYGIADVVAHALEAYFGKGQADLTDNIVVEIIKESIHKGQMLLNDLNNYELRADIMLAATMALNGITMYGRSFGDWGTHSIGHVLSSLYGLPHGASLTIAFPAWMKLHKNKLDKQIAVLGKKVFNSNSAEDTIYEFEGFFKKIKTPTRLYDFVPQFDKDNIIIELSKNKVNGNYHNISESDYKVLVELMTAH
ncbi:MAG: iron-containing alcohol dehydrogenase [Bacteroidales bacterium]|nr:iron-containing alcohol dehydrogenase [Bacteroidales bacterium]